MHNSSFPIEKILRILSLDHYLFAFSLLLLGFLFYKIFLKELSVKRHESLRQRFQKTLKLSLFGLTLALIINLSSKYTIIDFNEAIWGSYFLLLTLIISVIALVKIAQIIAYLYLFYSNMKHGIPRLMANMFTFFFSIIIIHLLASQVFEIQLSALLATSAVFSLVLGLALQDTLGNLFSGIALQIETPFQIGDWIEVDGRQKQWLGQVVEINWRATFLMSFADELIMIPNRIIAQSEIMIISQGNNNIRIGQAFRFSYDSDIEKIKTLLLETMKGIEGVALEPPVRLLITETQESYFVLKIFYSLVDFSKRYRVGDQILTEIITALKIHQIKLQSTRVELIEDRSVNN